MANSENFLYLFNFDSFLETVQNILTSRFNSKGDDKATGPLHGLDDFTIQETYTGLAPPENIDSLRNNLLTQFQDSFLVGDECVIRDNEEIQFEFIL